MFLNDILNLGNPLCMMTVCCAIDSKWLPLNPWFHWLSYWYPMSVIPVCDGLDSKSLPLILLGICWVFQHWHFDLCVWGLSLVGFWVLLILPHIFKYSLDVFCVWGSLSGSLDSGHSQCLHMYPSIAFSISVWIPMLSNDSQCFPCVSVWGISLDLWIPMLPMYLCV